MIRIVHVAGPVPVRQYSVKYYCHVKLFGHNKKVFSGLQSLNNSGGSFWSLYSTIKTLWTLSTSPFSVLLNLQSGSLNPPTCNIPKAFDPCERARRRHHFLPQLCGERWSRQQILTIITPFDLPHHWWGGRSKVSALPWGLTQLVKWAGLECIFLGPPLRRAAPLAFRGRWEGRL